MKSLLSKLNEVFDKSTNFYLRFLISLLVVLIPFFCMSILVLITVKNYLRAVVLILFLLASYFERTKDNKIILGFIGIIPLGFYVVTSPLITGWYLGTVVKDIGGIMFNNPVTTIISSVSIYVIIQGLKGTTSIYEWFVNTGFGGYFFPGYKNLKDQISLQNRTITQLLTEQNALIIALRSAKITLQQLKLDTQGLFNRLMDSQNTGTSSLSPQSINNAIIPIQNDVSVSTIQIQQQITQTIDNTIDNIDSHLTQNQQNTQQIMTIQQQSNVIIPVSDSTLIAVQKVFTGGAILLAGDQLLKLLGNDNSILVQGFNMTKNSIGSWVIPLTGVTSYVIGDITTRTIGGTVNGVKTITATASEVFKETHNLVKKGVKNIIENMKFIPNVGRSQEFIKIDVIKPITPEQLKLQLLEALKEADKKQAIPNTNIDPTKGQFKDIKMVKNLDAMPGKIQDISLVRKSTYHPPITPSLPPTSTTKSSPYGENFKIIKNPQTWVS